MTSSSHRLPWVVAVLVVLLVVAVLASAALGAFDIPLGDLWPALLHRPPDSEQAALQQDVLWQIRLPRVALAALVGCTLAVAGVVMQGIFANPLAEPGLVGVSSGAALAAIGAIALGLTAVGAWLLPAAAFVGALVVTWVVYRLARVNGRTEVVTVILTGVAVNAFAGAIIGLVMSIVDDAALRSVTFWTLGSVSTASWTSVASIAVAGVIGFALLPLVVRPLDLLALGERNAANLGVDVMRTRAIAIVITAILAGAAVATAGMLVFVGLVVPHAMRLVVGPRHRGLVIASALAGAFLIVTADLLARTVVAPREIPLGVLTGLIGAPAFFILLRREHARRGAWA